ncbi:MAG: response regulator [Verrucomicrobiales bacterium]|nr:response regulator [Verrucomicrobiales bacterium]
MNPTETAPAPAQTTAPEQKNILIVDDEAPMQMLASTIVNKLGYASTTASSGEEAVEAFEQAVKNNKPFTAVVMDLALPGGMSGLEATIAIKQIDANAKIIVSSGYLEQNARSAALEHGFAGILPKPYTADRLASELRFVLK